MSANLRSRSSVIRCAPARAHVLEQWFRAPTGTTLHAMFTVFTDAKVKYALFIKQA